MVLNWFHLPERTCVMKAKPLITEQLGCGTLREQIPCNAFKHLCKKLLLERERACREHECKSNQHSISHQTVCIRRTPPHKSKAAEVPILHLSCRFPSHIYLLTQVLPAQIPSIMFLVEINEYGSLSFPSILWWCGLCAQILAPNNPPFNHCWNFACCFYLIILQSFIRQSWLFRKKKTTPEMNDTYFSLTHSSNYQRAFQGYAFLDNQHEHLILVDLDRILIFVSFNRKGLPCALLETKTTIKILTERIKSAGGYQAVARIAENYLWETAPHLRQLFCFR